MALNIDLAASLTTARADSFCKSTGITSNASQKVSSFRNSLEEAVRSKGWNPAREDRTEVYQKDMVKKSVSKLENERKLDENAEDEKDKSSDKSIENSLAEIIEQMLSKLEELEALQKQGNVPTEGQRAVLECIKEAIADLGTVQTKTMGADGESLQSKTESLTAVLDEMLEELASNGKLNKSEAKDKLSAMLKTLLTQETMESKLQASDTTGTDEAAGIAFKTQENTVNANGEKAADNVNAEQGSNKNVGLAVESRQPGDASANNDKGMKEGSAAADSAAKSNAAVADTENTEDVKAAVDSKVAKISEEDGKGSKHSEEAGSIREGQRTVNGSAKTVQSKLENTGVLVNQEQAVIDGEPEVVQDQATAAKSEPLNKAEIINQIVKKAEVVVSDTQSEIRMQLEPENLGKLTLKLSVEKGLITAKFVAESYQVKQVIESNLNELRDMLQEKGLDVQNFSVSVGQESKQYNDNSFQQWKESVRLNGRNLSRGSYEGYLDGESSITSSVNPYSVHSGMFDHRA